MYIEKDIFGIHQKLLNYIPDFLDVVQEPQGVPVMFLSIIFIWKGLGLRQNVSFYL